MPYANKSAIQIAGQEVTQELAGRNGHNLLLAAASLVPEKEGGMAAAREDEEMGGNGDGNRY